MGSYSKTIIEKDEDLYILYFYRFTGKLNLSHEHLIFIVIIFIRHIRLNYRVHRVICQLLVYISHCAIAVQVIFLMYQDYHLSRICHPRMLCICSGRLEKVLLGKC